MPWHRTFLIVTGCSLVGMCLGGGFGFGAAWLAPGLFELDLFDDSLEPAGVATVVGAFGGVFLGAGLAAGAVLLDLFTKRSGWNDKSTG